MPQQKIQNCQATYNSNNILLISPHKKNLKWYANQCIQNSIDNNPNIFLCLLKNKYSMNKDIMGNISVGF